MRDPATPAAAVRPTAQPIPPINGFQVVDVLLGDWFAQTSAQCVCCVLHRMFVWHKFPSKVCGSP